MSKRLAIPKVAISEQEKVFFICFYNKDSETRFDVEKSAMKAGFRAEVAAKKGHALIKKYGYAGVQESLSIVGITKPYLASKLFEIIENPKHKDNLQAISLSFRLTGETTNESQGNTTNTYNAPVMVIAGMSDKRLAALRSALTPEQLEEQENQRCQQKLELLKQGKLPQLPSKTQMKEFERVPQKKVLHQHVADDSGDSEATTPAGGPAGGVESGDDSLS